LPTDVIYTQSKATGLVANGGGSAVQCWKRDVAAPFRSHTKKKEDCTKWFE